jgi:hypothetical protein
MLLPALTYCNAYCWHPSNRRLYLHTLTLSYTIPLSLIYSRRHEILPPCREAARAKKDAQCASNAKDIAKAKEERTKKIAAKKVGNIRVSCPFYSVFHSHSFSCTLSAFHFVSHTHIHTHTHTRTYTRIHPHMHTHTHTHTHTHSSLLHTQTPTQTLNREEEKVSLGEIQNVMANGTQWEKVCVCVCVCVCV